MLLWVVWYCVIKSAKSQGAQSKLCVAVSQNRETPKLSNINNHQERNPLKRNHLYIAVNLPFLGFLDFEKQPSWIFPMDVTEFLHSKNHPIGQFEHHHEPYIGCITINIVSFMQDANQSWSFWKHHHYLPSRIWSSLTRVFFEPLAMVSPFRRVHNDQYCNYHTWFYLSINLPWLVMIKIKQNPPLTNHQFAIRHH